MKRSASIRSAITKKAAQTKSAERFDGGPEGSEDTTEMCGLITPPDGEPKPRVAWR